MPTTTPSQAPGPARLIGRGHTLAPFDSCPTCDGESLHAEATVDRPVFRCASCGAGWMYELGYVRRVGLPR